ncbi:unnamed protein product [Blepharisma stoltei]|uniref:Mago nashi n=1 Tax=Blepharisma stoltei TaxID=1481888 RepID=A0AAU9IXZ5_9CILI|nr:unnamed protein product [Blepharisma stoltei]
MERTPDFYLRYYIGHKGKFGHEFLEYEITNEGRLRYANNSNYRNEPLIRKEVYINRIVIEEIKRLVNNSEVLSQDDSRWPEPNNVGRQELEIVIGEEHVFFITSKIGSFLDVQRSEDPEGLRSFFYLVQDIKCLVLTLMSMHFRIKPV